MCLTVRSVFLHVKSGSPKADYIGQTGFPTLIFHLSKLLDIY